MTAISENPERIFHGSPDDELLKAFDSEVGSRIPHLDATGAVLNSTPLIDLSEELRQCAHDEYRLDLSQKRFRVLGKFEGGILSGSIKVRPAAWILEDAIRSGKLRRGQVVFEATSGNFGIALGLLNRLGLKVIILVSRRLQEGVVKELSEEGANVVNLDVEICPAPGIKVDVDALTVEATASGLRDQLVAHGLDGETFDASIDRIRRLLSAQDVINLAKLLAEMYGGFCPRQYENELNLGVHRSLTSRELEQQVRAAGEDLRLAKIVTAFGTGGTSGGIARFAEQEYGQKTVHVVFPQNGQDVAGIRTRATASGLPFYEPARYAGEHEVDFEAAKPLFRYFGSRGYDIGESGALCLYAVLQMVNFGAGEKFVVVLADGVKKYARTLQVPKRPVRMEVSAQEAAAEATDYALVLWTHNMFVPNEAGKRLIASSLGVDESKLKIARVRDLQSMVATDQVPSTIRGILPANGKVLTVCMAGGTSLRAARVLGKHDVAAESLKGGLVNLANLGRRTPQELIQLATG